MMKNELAERGHLEQRTTLRLDEQAASRLRFVARLNAALGLALGAGGVGGWLFEHPLLTSYYSSSPAMLPVTGLCLVALGACLLLARRFPRLTVLAAALVCLAAGVCLALTIIPLDGLLLHRPDGLSTWRPVTMAPAVSLALVSLACGLIAGRFAPLRLRADWWGRVVTAISLIALFGYATGADALHSVWLYRGISLPTALGLFFLSVGFILRDDQIGVAELLAASSGTGGMTFRLLSAVVAVPVLLGLLVSYAVGQAMIPNTFGLGVSSTLTVVLLGHFVAISAKQLRTSELRRTAAEEARQLILEDLRHTEKMEAVGRLAGGLAHDFNNLLMVILAHAEMAREDFRLGQEKEAHSCLAQIEKAGLTARDLTQQLLTFSRRQPRKTDELDLNQVVLSMESLLTRALPPEIELCLHLGPNLPLVRADVSGLDQVLLNLIVNARDAMPNGGTITIATDLGVPRSSMPPPAASREGSGGTPPAWVRLTVSDTGCGMDSATRARIFDPFFTTKADAGTGLGLSTVFALVTQYQGNIAVDSIPGVGSTFTLLFPGAARATSGTRRVTAASEVPPASRLPGSCAG